MSLLVLDALVVRGKVAVQVVIDLPALLGLAEHPAELVGYGPLPAPVARALARDATWTRLVTEPVTGFWPLAAR